MQEDRRATLTIGRDYCRGCERTSTQRFAGWATADGHENSSRPRAFYRTCDVCGTARLVLGNVNDAEGICRSVLKRWLGKSGTGARVGPTEQPTGDGSFDAEDALGFLQQEVWRLYLRWNPVKTSSFLAFANFQLLLKLHEWSREESGEAQTRPGGRRFPKAHAASVSVSLDAATFGDDQDGDGGKHERINGEPTTDGSGGSSRLRAGAFVADDASAGSSPLLRALTTRSSGQARDQRGARDADAERAARSGRQG